MKTSRRSLVIILALAVFSLIIYAIVRTAWLGEQNVVGVNALPPVVNPVLPPPHITEGDADQILVNDATDLANPNRVEAAERLILLTKNDKDSYANISKVLIEELRTSCVSDELSTNAQFTKVESLAVILAKMKDLEALDTLIDCSNFRSASGGLSYRNYPTVEPIADFGDLAIPSLINKYRYAADTPTKCRLASIISMIGGPKASHSLKDLRRNEIDDTLKKCLENCLRASSNRKE